MLTVLAVLQGVLVLSMVLLVLVQKTTSDGMANLASSSAKSIHSSMKVDFIKKSTMFFATAFIINSIVMANIGYHTSNSNSIEKHLDESNNEEILDDE